MSRFIDPDRPYTEEEKQYLLSRSSGPALIAVNERKFAHLDEERRKALTNRVDEDAEKERQIEEEIDRQMAEEEEDSYHQDDIDAVAPLNIAQLRAKLEAEGLSSKVSEKDKKGEGDPLTEKEVLAYRLLNRLDEKRAAASPQ